MVLAPLIFLPLPIIHSSEVCRCILLSTAHCWYNCEQAGKCAYVVLVMATYWVAEVIPLAATALLPIALLPLLGVRASKDVCVNYLQV